MAATIGAVILKGSAAKKVVESVVDDLYQLGKARANRELKKWKAASHVEMIGKQIKQIRLVKTILQPEKEVDLVAFYHPAQIKMGKTSIIVTRLSDIKHDGSIVIEGTAGQGKSILLRYLASSEFFLAKTIPIFIELRKMRPGQTLLTLALQELKVLGFEMDEGLFRLFASEGRFLFLLDAFDEAKEELLQDLISEIEDLIRMHEKLRFVITSRPHSPISTSPLVRVFKLRPLSGKEYEEVLRKMAHDSTTAEAIINGIQHDARKVAPLLTTPLMVALLMVRYKIDQSLPQNSASFYDSLFLILLQRHDKMKGGFVRPRKSKLGDLVLQEFFSALCYISRKADETAFSHTSLCDYARTALETINQVADVEKAVDDVVSITCLIISDGDDYRFIHKSVQEYGAALFIEAQPEEVAATFYSAMHVEWVDWDQELAFLETIDQYRFLKYFHTEELRRALALTDGGSAPVIDKALLSRLFGKDSTTIGTENFRLESARASWPTWHRLVGSGYFGYLLSLKNEPVRVPSITMTVDEILADDALGQKMESACIVFCKKLIKDLHDSEEFIVRAKRAKGLFEFDPPFPTNDQ
jgi:hypothetical protein